MSARRSLLSASCLYPSLRINAIGAHFDWNEHWMHFLFSHKAQELGAAPAELLSQSASFSHGEQLMVRIALDIWSSQGKAQVSNLLDVLDDDTFLRMISSLLHFRELSRDDLPVFK